MFSEDVAVQSFVCCMRTTKFEPWNVPISDHVPSDQDDQDSLGVFCTGVMKILPANSEGC